MTTSKWTVREQVTALIKINKAALSDPVTASEDLVMQLAINVDALAARVEALENRLAMDDGK